MSVIPRKQRLKNARRALTTTLGLRQNGFFIPFRHAASVPRPPPVYSALEHVFEAAQPQMQKTLDLISDAIATPDGLVDACAGPLATHWNGGYFGPLDTAAAFALARHYRPERVVEVGSGSSTHVLAAAIGATAIQCIDPVPRHSISALGVRWEEAVLDQTHTALFEALGPGDIAFFDSSHVLFEGTDVDIIENRILPVLAKGVIVHIHDVFLPDPYPEDWQLRAYTEQIGLGGWLCGGAYRVLFSSHYAASRMRDQTLDAMSGLPPHAHPDGGSLWLERV